MINRSRAAEPVQAGYSPVRGGRRIRMSAVAIALGLAGIGQAAASNYIEQGKAGDAASWRSSEFNAEWGLGAPTPH